MFRKCYKKDPDPTIGRGTVVPLVHGLSEALGPDYCILFYALTGGREARVAAVANGALAGLAVGDDAPEADRAAIDESLNPGAPGSLQYFSITAAGRRLRSDLIRIDGAGDAPPGFLVLHYDMSRVELLQELVSHLTGGRSPEVAQDAAARADGLVEQGLQRAARHLGKPLSFAGKVEKIQVVEWLDREGFFLFKGAVEALAREMGNTKYTIYAYLRESRMRSPD